MLLLVLTMKSFTTAILLGLLCIVGQLPTASSTSLRGWVASEFAMRIYGQKSADASATGEATDVAEPLVNPPKEGEAEVVINLSKSGYFL